MSIRIEQYDGGEVLYLALDPDGAWAKSEFPDELVTVDYNAQGGIIGLEVVGTLARTVMSGLVEGLFRSGELEGVADLKQTLVAAG